MIHFVDWPGCFVNSFFRGACPNAKPRRFRSHLPRAARSLAGARPGPAPPAARRACPCGAPLRGPQRGRRRHRPSARAGGAVNRPRRQSWWRPSGLQGPRLSSRWLTAPEVGRCGRRGLLPEGAALERVGDPPDGGLARSASPVGSAVRCGKALPYATGRVGLLRHRRAERGRCRGAREGEAWCQG